MPISPIIYDMRCLQKLIKTATGLKVYKAEVSGMAAFMYRSITDEYHDSENAHISVARGSWSCNDGGEYKISIYLPCISLKNKVHFNKSAFQHYVDQITNAFNAEFGERNWSACNGTSSPWKPMARFSYYVQIPNFKQ